MPASVVIVRLYFPCFERRSFFVGLDCATFRLLPDAKICRGDVGVSQLPDASKGGLGDGASPPFPDVPVIYNPSGYIYNGGSTSGKRGRTSGNGFGERPVMLLPDGEHNGAPPVSHVPPLQTISGRPTKAERLYTREVELNEVRAVLAETAGWHAALMDKLGPSDAEQAACKVAIRGTHGLVWGRPAYWPDDRDPIELVLFKNADGDRAARSKPFDRLLDLAAEWGRMRQERRHVGAMLKSLQREARRLTREIGGLTNPDRKAA
jgi:hypothetical protein